MSLALFATIGCGGTVQAESTAGDAGSDALPQIDAAPDAGLPPVVGPGPTKPPPVAPPTMGCEDGGDVLIELVCDAFDPLGPDCVEGQACYLVGAYDEDPCGNQQVVAACLPYGDGEDGAPCSDHSHCAPGLSCLISGYCRLVCRPDEIDSCPNGMVCHPTPYLEGLCF